MKVKLDYNINWSKYFRLNAESPSGLLRIKDYRDKDIEGYPVGSQNFRKNGEADAWVLCFNYRQYAIHRIIWVLVHDSVDPEMVVDHLDGNPFNNKIHNLSLKTTADNLRNRCMLRNNKTGVTGVKLLEVGDGALYYVAQWQNKEGKTEQRHFSIDKFGEQVAKELATNCRRDQIKKRITEGAGYTDRHGN